MPCLAAKAWVRDASRAATAAITTSALPLAGLMTARGAIRAAPRTPTRTCPDTELTLALGPVCRGYRRNPRQRAAHSHFSAPPTIWAPGRLAPGATAGEGGGVFGPDPDADEVGGQEGQPRQPLQHAEQR